MQSACSPKHAKDNCKRQKLGLPMIGARMDQLVFLLFCVVCSSLCSAQVLCPDGQSECPSNNTCCLRASGGYGCCPLPHANCCPDEVHCCPSGYQCTTSACEKSTGETVAFLQTDRAKPRHHHFTRQDSAGEHGHGGAKLAIVCPDGRKCSDDQTCCLMKSSMFGCCPIPNAVCCPNGVQCCPSGYSCADGTCVGKSGNAMVTALRLLTRQEKMEQRRHEKTEQRRHKSPVRVI